MIDTGGLQCGGEVGRPQAGHDAPVARGSSGTACGTLLSRMVDAVPLTSHCRRCGATIKLPAQLSQETLRELGTKVRGGVAFMMGALKQAGMDMADAKALAHHLTRNGVCNHCSAKIPAAPVYVCECRSVNVDLTQVANALEPTNLVRLFELWKRTETNATGQEIFERIEEGRQPAWAADILQYCARKYSGQLHQVDDVVVIARDVRRWSEGHRVFDQVRLETLRCEREGVKDRQRVTLLFLAEIAAKVIYNASGAPAPFDHDAGWWMARCLRQFVVELPDASLAEQEAWQLLTAPLSDHLGGHLQ